MSKFLSAVVLIISGVFLLTGGTSALMAFWIVIGILLVPIAVICGIDRFLKRKKTA